MKLSKKQVIYGLLLAAAGVAYAIDAAFFGPPAAARANQAAGDASAISAAKPATGEATAVDEPEHALTSRLQKWASDNSTSLADMPDVFQPPVITKPVPVAAVPPPPPEDPAVAFNRQHRLIAIVLDGEGGYALIDGRVLRIGQLLDGTKLIGLTRQRARFATSDRTFDVPLTPLTADVRVDQ
jgi:hypothetical protein